MFEAAWSPQASQTLLLSLSSSHQAGMGCCLAECHVTVPLEHLLHKNFKWVQTDGQHRNSCVTGWSDHAAAVHIRYWVWNLTGQFQGPWMTILGVLVHLVTKQPHAGAIRVGIKPVNIYSGGWPSEAQMKQYSKMLYLWGRVAILTINSY
jgi:hypothetical protein